MCLSLAVCIAFVDNNLTLDSLLLFCSVGAFGAGKYISDEELEKWLN